MGIIIIGAICLIVGIILYKCFIDDILYSEGWLVGGIIGILLGAVILISCGICCLVENYGAQAEKTYEDLAHTKAVIEYRLENSNTDESLTINGGVYDDLIEYNNTIREYKMMTHNFWVGWFYSDKPATLEYIELPKSVS